MKPEKMNSLIALITPVVTALVTAFQPQLQHFWTTPTGATVLAIGGVVVSIWNNVSEPVHK
jgi:hypothetical protein